MATDKFSVKQGIQHTNDATIVGSTIVETGTVAMYPSATPPTGWLECNGSEQPIATYENLYNTLTTSGTIFPFGANTNGGGGVGSTHFRLPDLRGRTVVCTGAGTGLTSRTLGDWGGSESIAVTNAITAHTHTFEHTHTQPHTHDTTHASNAHGWSHTHTLPSHYHPISAGSNAHNHTTWFGNTTASGTAQRRLQSSSGTLDATSVYPAGTHGHTVSAANVSFALDIFDNAQQTTPTASSTVTGSGGTSTDAPSASNTQPNATGAVSTISVMQKSYVLKYIIKA